MTSTPRVVCPVCGRLAEEFGRGPRRRPNAMCGKCRALERHRFLAVLLATLAPEVARRTTVLDVAPTTGFSPVVRRVNPSGYVSIDFDPDADGRIVDRVASITDLPFPDDSVGLVVCYHVLEHVPDDRQGMRELARVLAPGGIAFVQVPYRADVSTVEDVSASPEERVRRFGQADHVRMYGHDFGDRLIASGLAFRELTPAEVADETLVRWIGALPGERVWLCATEPESLPTVPEVRAAVEGWALRTLSAGVASEAVRVDAAREVEQARAETRRANEAAARHRAGERRARRRLARLQQRRAVRIADRLGRVRAVAAPVRLFGNAQKSASNEQHDRRRATGQAP